MCVYAVVVGGVDVDDDDADAAGVAARIDGVDRAVGVHVAGDVSAADDTAVVVVVVADS